MSTRTVAVAAFVMLAIVLGLVGLSVLAANQVHRSAPSDPVLVIAKHAYDRLAVGTRAAALQTRFGGPLGLPQDQELRDVVRSFGAAPATGTCTYLRISATRIYARLCFSADGRLAGKRLHTP